MSEGHTHADSIHIDRSPAEVYALITDIGRTGEWSPICQTCWWNEDGGPRVGATFTGRNVTANRTWETVSTVLAAEPGVEFAWHVGEGYARWGYTLEPEDGGARLTESWHFRPAGLARFAELYGDEAPAQIDNRIAAARDGIPATLAALKRIAESS